MLRIEEARDVAPRVRGLLTRSWRDGHESMTKKKKENEMRNYEMMCKSLLSCALLSVALMAGCKNETKPTEPSEKEVVTTPAEETTAPAEEVEKPAEEEKKGEVLQEAKGGRVEAAEEGGKWVISTAYDVKFRVPEDWTITIEEDGVSATDSDETTTVVLIGSESQGTIQTAVQDVQKKVKIKDAKLQDTTDGLINGIPAQSVTGTAVFTKGEGEEQMDQEIQFIAHNVKFPESVVTMMIFSEATMYEAKKETIDGLANTLVKATSK